MVAPATAPVGDADGAAESNRSADSGGCAAGRGERAGAEHFQSAGRGDGVGRAGGYREGDGRGRGGHGEGADAGSAGPDFAGISGESTCPTASFSASGGGSCTESVTFTPAYPGPRAGRWFFLTAAAMFWHGVSFRRGHGRPGRVDSGNAVAVAGEYRNWTSTKNGVLATAANLDQPSTVAFDGAGNMYIADSSHNEIRKVTAPAPPAVAGIISVLAGTGDPAYTGDGDRRRLRP